MAADWLNTHIILHFFLILAPNQLLLLGLKLSVTAFVKSCWAGIHPSCLQPQYRFKEIRAEGGFSFSIERLSLMKVSNDHKLLAGVLPEASIFRTECRWAKEKGKGGGWPTQLANSHLFDIIFLPLSVMDSKKKELGSDMISLEEVLIKLVSVCPDGSYFLELNVPYLFFGEEL